MVLAHNELLYLIHNGIVENATEDLVNGTSIDVTLGEQAILETKPPHSWDCVLTLRGRMPFTHETINIGTNGLVIPPGKFVLLQSQQVFNLPLDISMDYKLKSSMARIGLEHLNAGWCDPGWHSSVLTLEFKNMLEHHSIVLFPGDRIGQVVFYRHQVVEEKHSYRAKGRYNGDRTVKGIKP